MKNTTQQCTGKEARVILCLGSNIEPRLAYLDRAQAALCALPSTRFSAASETEETEPVGVPPEFASQKFLNRILVVETALSPRDFSARMHRIELDLGRVRGKVRNTPRTIDIDMVDYEGVTSGDPALTLPHPRARERDFVAGPLRRLGIARLSDGIPLYNHNVQRKAAVINDFTSFGRCSLAVTIPILSAMKVQCCPVPTAMFTNHTGFESFAWTDNTPHLDSYIDEWRKLGLRFNAIQTGFLGSHEQVDFVLRFLSAFRTPGTTVCIDPVMGDYGRLYPTYDSHLAESMRGFLDVADILTPNLTEACFLADEPYRTDFTDAELAALCAKVDVRRAARIVISGIPRGDTLVNFIYESGRAPSLCVEPRIGTDRSGTGDVFSSVILADAVNGVDFAASVRKASRFTAAAVRRSVEMGIPEKDGLAIEEVLKELIA